MLVHNADYPKSPGDYEKAPYHNKGNDVKSAAPVDGQATLDSQYQLNQQLHEEFQLKVIISLFLMKLLQVFFMAISEVGMI